jgi:spore germination protein
LYKKSADIQKELRKVQHMVIQNNLRWMDVELALASGQKQMDNTIIDGFKTVEKNVASYSETDFGPAFASIEKKEEGFKHIKGADINAQQAKDIAKKFLGINKDVDIRVTNGGKGAGFDFYSLRIHDPKTKAETYMDITKKGGYPIWVMQNRKVNNQNISLNEASIRAANFLKKQNFENLELFESAQYDNIGVFTFVPNIKGVRIYPDAIKIKVALDNGNIVGYSAKDYLASNHIRHISSAKLPVAEARKKINKDVTIMEERKAIILNDIGNEVLCYEFLGTIDNDTYRIFINANTGQEEKVEKLKNAEPIFRQL